MKRHFGLPLAALAAALILLPACQAGSTTTLTATKTATSTVTATVTATTTTTATPTDTTTPTPTPETRVITDMYGRQVTVPTNITRILTTGPVEMQLVFMLAPDKLAGLAFTPNGNPPFVSEKYSSLPAVGGWFGTQVGNYETFIAANPDVILEGFEDTLDERQQKFGNIPVVGINSGDLMFNYAPAIRFLGELLDVQDKAQELINYYIDAMGYVSSITASIPYNDRVTVYYAEGQNGLNTDPLGSMHTALLAFCGGVNVADVQLLPGYGMATVSMEQILLWAPDMIIIGRGSQANLYKAIMADSLWNQLQAVKDGQVFVRPDNPFSWFDGPPGPCQIIGMYWMVNLLYPDETADLDLGAKIKEYYSKFMHYDLTDTELAFLLAKPS